MAPPPPTLPPLPQPGLAVHSPLWIAQNQTILLFKEKNGWRTGFTASISGQPYLEAKEEHHKEMYFRTPQGEEVLKIVKQSHKWSGRGDEYHGLRPDGSEAWHVKLHRGLKGTDYSK